MPCSGKTHSLERLFLCREEAEPGRVWEGLEEEETWRVWAGLRYAVAMLSDDMASPVEMRTNSLSLDSEGQRRDV